MSGSTHAVKAQMQRAQTRFLMDGGILAPALDMLREKGIIASEYVYQEYPKALNLSLGFREVPCRTELHDKRIAEWTEVRDIIAPLVVSSHEQERAVRAAFDRAPALGITVSETWSAEALLGIVADTEGAKSIKAAAARSPEQIKADRLATLRAEMERLDPSLAAAPAKPRGAKASPLPVVAPDPEA